MSDLFITIRFKAAASGLPPAVKVPRRVEEHLTRLMEEWSDGRRPFAVELMQDGLRRLVETAIRGAVEADIRSVVGAEMVRVSESSETSRAGIEAEEICKDLYVNTHHDVKVVAVEEEAEEDGTFRVLRRMDVLSDGSPGPYIASSYIFTSYDQAKLHTDGISTSRYPIIIPAGRLGAVLVALNHPANE